jgi:hypothetical protein
MSATAISHESPEEYTTILDIFQSNRQRVLEIEIVPSSIPPPAGAIVLIDEAFIGIPKKVLVKAFYYATRLFSKNLGIALDLVRFIKTPRVLLLTLGRMMRSMQLSLSCCSIRNI